MKKERKKLLSVFLTGLMIFSLLPVTALAETTTDQLLIQEDISEASEPEEEPEVDEEDSVVIDLSEVADVEITDGTITVYEGKSGSRSVTKVTDGQLIKLTGISNAPITINAVEEDVEVILADVSVTASEDDSDAPLTVNAAEARTVTLELDGVNKLNQYYDNSSDLNLDGWKHAALEKSSNPDTNGNLSDNLGKLVIQDENDVVGTLLANATANNQAYGGAGIGGARGKAATNIEITGGTIQAIGGSGSGTEQKIFGGAGIGGGDEGIGTNITISGGNVTATGGEMGGAGIGGGCGASGTYITISGGIVKAVTDTGSNEVHAYGAGIGGGGEVYQEGVVYRDGGNGENITITGGTVTAVGYKGTAGIGGADWDSCGSDITISGGNVYAFGGTSAAGIGGGYSGDAKNITISGGTVFATHGASGGAGGAGIGGGAPSGSYEDERDVGDAKNITISGGHVYAFGGDGGAGIGSGRGSALDQNSTVEEIQITGGEVYAYDGTPIIEDGKWNGKIKSTGGGAGIGSGVFGVGAEGETPDVKITGGTIYACGGLGGAGIGSGDSGNNVKVDISGGVVTAVSGDKDIIDDWWEAYGGAGIGGGTYPMFEDDVDPISSIPPNIVKISGDAKVTATGGLYAAGIGTGVGGAGADISITGNADVRAFGYDHAAAIGAGWKGGTASIELLDNAKVYAYGGINAQSIGQGNSSAAASLTLSDTIMLWAQNGNATQTALPKDTKYIKESENGGIYLTTYTSGFDSKDKASGRLTEDLATQNNAISVDWAYKSPQYVTLDGVFDVDTGKEQDSIPGNWATLYPASDPDPVPECGDLVVSKTVSGSGASSTKEFPFTVTLDNPTINETYGDMTFTNGVADFTLKAGENKLASGLPAGVGYTVEESDNAGYTVTVNGTSDTEATGTIEAGGTSIATFNNHKSGGGSGGITNPDPDGSVKITKIVKGNKAPAESIEYEFKAWVKNSSGNVVSEMASYRIAKADGTTDSGNITIGADGYIFRLKDGESITFSNITSGRSMEVKEITTGDFTTTTSGLNDKGVCVISGNTTNEVEFVNTYDEVIPTPNPDPTPTPDPDPTPTPTPEPVPVPTPDKPIDEIPQTGDNTNISLWFALAGCSLFGMVVCLSGRKRNVKRHR